MTHESTSPNLRPKVRIVAIARDEAAYLPEWVFHHLYFRFDEIKIYVNSTTDNSEVILQRINEHYPFVMFENIDGRYDHFDNKQHYQNRAYDDALIEARIQNCDYLFYLDIDEFWTPSDFQTTVHEHLSDLSGPDVISYQWHGKYNESLFARPYESVNALRQFVQVKSLFRTDLDIRGNNVHNVLAERATNVLSDGTMHPVPFGMALPAEHLTLPPKPVILLHRMWRHPLEYLSILHRGSPQRFTALKVSDGIFLKTSRKGFEMPKPSPPISFEIATEFLNRYNEAYKDFIEECDLNDHISLGRRATLLRGNQILQILENNIDHPDLQLAMRNLNLQECRVQLNVLLA